MSGYLLFSLIIFGMIATMFFKPIVFLQDSNIGAFSMLMDAVASQEVMQAVLCFFFLTQLGNGGAAVHMAWHDRAGQAPSFLFQDRTGQAPCFLFPIQLAPSFKGKESAARDGSPNLGTTFFFFFFAEYLPLYPFMPYPCVRVPF